MTTEGANTLSVSVNTHFWDWRAHAKVDHERPMSKGERQAVDQHVVEEAFGRLKPEHQRLLLWHKVDGLSYAEMAVRLGISQSRLMRKMAAMILSWCDTVEAIEARSQGRSV